jgi:molybdate transport system substrate-binding protein
MQFVSRGEAPYGIVYETDSKVDPGVHIVAAFPENSHPPIVYPVALTKTASPAAKDFLTYVSGPDAKAIFEKAGFTVLN